MDTNLHYFLLFLNNGIQVHYQYHILSIKFRCMQRIISITLFLLVTMTLSAQNINQKDEQGRKQGYWENITPLGRKIYTGNFKDGYPEGEMKRYHKNGTLKAILIFSNKGQHTQAQIFNDYGQLAASGNYIDKKKDSLWQYYDKNKRVRIQENYKNGFKQGLSSYYYPNGKLYESIGYENDVKHGHWKRFDNKGNKMIKAHYEKGKLEGYFTSYHANGVPKIDGFYKNNKRHEKWIFYSAKGKVNKTIAYEMGYADNQDELDAKQQKELEAMEANKDRFADPEHYIGDPNEYLRKQRRK